VAFRSSATFKGNFINDVFKLIRYGIRPKGLSCYLIENKLCFITIKQINITQHFEVGIGFEVHKILKVHPSSVGFELKSVEAQRMQVT
jgi:hypothetical protein